MKKLFTCLSNVACLKGARSVFRNTNTIIFIAFIAIFISYKPVFGQPSGGTITTANVGGTNYIFHTFTGTGSLIIPSATGPSNQYWNGSSYQNGITTNILVVAAGGAGGGGAWWAGGGGGGGFLAYNGSLLAPATYTATIGVGVYSGNGGNSSLSGTGINYVATGGGVGGSTTTKTGSAGGSGGGGANGSNGGAGTSGQGFAGGNSNSDSGGGGGGGGGVGAAGTASAGGAGGLAYTWPSDNLGAIYSGGGGGAGNCSTCLGGVGAGGGHGGGKASTFGYVAPTTGYGIGGSGGGGAGRSGIIIIRYTQPTTPGAITGTAATCTGQSYTYSIAPVVNASTYTWTVPGTWSITAGSGTTTITVTAGSAGGNISVLIPTAFGNTGSSTYAVSVNAVPTISGTTPNSRCGTGTVGLGATASAGTVNWWFASTGGTSQCSGNSWTTPSISSNTTYYVDATASGCTTASRTSILATVKTIPTSVSATATPNPVCAGTTLSLTGAATDATSWSWTGPNGYTSTLQSPPITNVTSAMAGVYSLTAYNSGCPASPVNTASVTVNAIPTITFTTPGSRCGTGTVALGATASAGTVNWWLVSTGGTSQGSGNSWTTPSIGTSTTYWVDATVGTCTTASRTSVAATINSVPTPPTAGSNSPVCQGNSLNLTSSTVSGATYTWAGPNSYSSSSQNPTLPNVTTAANGTYYVSATLSGCPDAVGTTVVTINSAPAATASASPNPVCTSGTLSLTGSCTGNCGGSPSYSWSGPNSYTSSSQSPTIANPTTSGAYTLTVTNGSGCTGTASTSSVTVSSPPVATASASSNIVCSSGTFNLTGGCTSNCGVSPTYSWSGPGSYSSSTQSPTVSNPTSTGLYTLSVTNSSGCIGTASTNSVTVVTNPVPVITGNSAVCTGSTGNTYTTEYGMTGYTWVVSGGTITAGGGTGNNYVTVTWTSAGAKSVSVNYTNVIGCQAASPTSFIVN